MSIALILAAGEAERHNGGNKPLLKVGNETLLERMVRQVKPHVGSIYIVTHREDLTHPDCKIFKPPKHDFIAETLWQTPMIWCLGSRTIVLLGDVYYSDSGIVTILGSEDLRAFGQSPNIHAMNIPYQNAFWLSGELSEFCKRVKQDPKTYFHGKLHGFCWFSKIRVSPLEGTTDIDSPQEHKRLLAKLEL